MSKNKSYSSYSENMNRAERTRLITARVFSYLFLFFVAFICIIFFYLLIINATRTNNENVSGLSIIPSSSFIQNFRNVILVERRFSLPHSMLNSFIIAASSSVLSIYFSAMTAYGIHVYNFKGKRIAYNFILAVMMIPAQVTTLGFLRLINGTMLPFNLMDTFWPLIIPAIAAPSIFFYMKQYMDSTIPLEVVEAARVDGSNEFRTFNFIVFPMLKPAVAVQLIFAFVASWNNLFLPNLVLTKQDNYTVPIVLAFLRSDMMSQDQDLGMLYMTIFLSIIPVIIVYVILSKFIIKGVTLGSVKG